MKIAFCRFNQNTDLDYSIASVSALNTDNRLGALEGLVELGHDVTIVSFVSKKHQHVFEGKCAVEGMFDNSWMKRMKYDLDPDMSEFDLMIVETSALNTMYSFKGDDGHAVSFIAHYAKILKRSKGLPILVWHHGAGSISYPFSRIGMDWKDIPEEELNKLSPNNYKNIFRDIDIYEYNYHIWHHAVSNNMFMQTFGDVYAKEGVRLEGLYPTVVGYSDRYDKLHYPVMLEKQEFDLVYVGKARSPERIERVKEFYDIPNTSSLIVGNGWGDVDFMYDVSAPGPSKAHGDVQDQYRKGCAVVFVADDDLAKSGMQVTRSVHTLRSGVLAFADARINQAIDLVGEECFVVNTGEELSNQLDIYITNQKVFDEAVIEQNTLLTSWQDVMDGLLSELEI